MTTVEMDPKAVALESNFSSEDAEYLKLLLTNRLREVVNSGVKYDLIIGDDTSGRIPALVVGKVLSAFIPHKDMGLKTLFFNGNWDSSDSSQNRQISEKISGSGRVLFVTESVEGGTTLAKFKHIFDSTGIGFDSLTLLACHEEDYYKESLGFDSQQRLFIGKVAGINEVVHNPFLHARSDLTGLDRPQTVNSGSIHSIPNRGEGVNRQIVAGVREQIGIIANGIVGDLRAN